MTAPMDDGTGAADETLAIPTPEWIEAQRQAALTCLLGARHSLRIGLVSTCATQLQAVETHLRAMDPGVLR